MAAEALHREKFDTRERVFNAYLSSVRILAENSFGKLKARWRMIGRKIDARIDLAPQIIATCCALHNICERDNTPITDE